MDDNDGQMIFGDLEGLKLPDICLTGEEKNPEKKNSPRKLVPTGDRTRARCYRQTHSGGHGVGEFRYDTIGSQNFVSIG